MGAARCPSGRFCLLADLGIRERTENRRGLQDALRAIVASGGNITRDWPLEQVLETGDRATGTHVLHELYDEMGDKPAWVDLDALWRRLGVSVRNGTVGLDDSAPLASIRRAITTRAPRRDRLVSGAGPGASPRSRAPGERLLR